MFALTENMRYYLCQHYVDMRKGMTGLYQLIKSDMSLSPVSGDVFVFFSHKRDMVKILRWDTDGFILYQKRLEEGTFEVPRFNPSTGRLVDDTFYIKTCSGQPSAGNDSG